MQKKQKKVKRNKIKKDKIANVILYCIIGTIVLGTIGLGIFARLNGKGTTDISENEWNYMINYINQEFGEGEEIHIISKDVNRITKTDSYKNPNKDYPTSRTKTLGARVSIVGYFDSQDKIYSVGFVRYNNDYKNYEAGKITFSAVATNYSKEDYLKNK